MTRRPSAIVCVCALTVMGGVWLAAQAPPDRAQPVFAAGIDLVPVDVSVLDNRRRPVTGLTAADFTILEDGRPRPVEAFAAIDLRGRVRGAEASWARDVPPDVATNEDGETEGRLVVILMDRTIPLGQPTITARGVAAAAINELAPGDLAAVVSTSGGVPQNFTADRSRLLRAIDQRDWSTGISKDAEALPTIGKQDPLSDGRCLCGLCVLETVTRVAEAVQDAPARRKVLFFVGASLIVQAASRAGGLGCDRLVRDARRKMIDALALSNLTVHSIDPSGLVNIGPQTRAGALGGQPGHDGPAERRQMMLDETTEQLNNQGTLRVLPDLTGGRTVLNTNGPETTVPELFRESDSYYLLGFRPSNADGSGQIHTIDVRVNRRGVNVHARRRYAMPGTPNGSEGSSSSSPLADAIDGLLPTSRVAMDLHAASFALPGAARALVTIAAGVGDFAPEAPPSGAPVATPFELVAGAYDATGRPQASARQRLELSWPAATGDAVPGRVEALSRLDLEPGDYEIRIAAAGADATRTAGVTTYLTVPDYAAAPFSLSHIVFAASAATSTVPPGFLAGVLPVVPTTERAFTRAGGATAFLQIYQGTARRDALQPVTVRVRIINVQDAAVGDQSHVLTPDEFRSDRTANSRLALPIENLVPGEYLLRIDATMGERMAGRVVRFEVK